MPDLFLATGQTIAATFTALLFPAVVFALLAVLVKGRGAIAAAMRALPETRTTLILMAVNAVVAVPVLSLIWSLMHAWLPVVRTDLWAGLPPVVVALVAVFVGDLVGYWRHRLEHTQLLWPSHDGKPCRAAGGWTAAERDAYEAGQLDASSSIAAACRAKAED